MSLSEKMFRSQYLKDSLELVQGLKTKNRADFYFAEDVKEIINEFLLSISDLNNRLEIKRRLLKLAGDDLK